MIKKSSTNPAKENNKYRCKYNAVRRKIRVDSERFVVRGLLLLHILIQFFNPYISAKDFLIRSGRATNFTPMIDDTFTPPKVYVFDRPYIIIDDKKIKYVSNTVKESFHNVVKQNH